MFQLRQEMFADQCGSKQGGDGKSKTYGCGIAPHPDDLLRNGNLCNQYHQPEQRIGNNVYVEPG